MKRLCFTFCRARRLNARGGEHGAQLLEFVLVFPLLALLVVGAWDFGSAFVMKQKLTNAAREGARIVISNSILAPLSGPCSGVTIPCPITTAKNTVALYLYNAGMTDASCLNSAPVSTQYQIGPPPSGLASWTWTCGGITLTINRMANLGTDTSVSLAYPVNWSLVNFMSNVYQQFQGATVQPVQITTTVTMPNLT